MTQNQKNRLALHAEIAANEYHLTADSMVSICKASIAYAFHQVVTSDIDVLGETREENLKLLAQAYYNLQALRTTSGDWTISDEEIADAICGR